jgi:hypothetical protein
VTVTTSIQGGRLAVAVTAGAQAVGNKLLSLQFGPDSRIPVPNVLLDLPGIGDGIVPAGQNVGVPGTLGAYTFFVRRQNPSLPATVPFTVNDTCGAWPAVVGGGEKAGF